MALPKLQRMTAREFSQLPESNQPTELIYGEVVVSPAPDDVHQKISYRVTLFLSQAVPDGEIRYAPIDVYLDDENVFQPDVMWVSAANENCVLENGIHTHWHFWHWRHI